MRLKPAMRRWVVSKLRDYGWEVRRNSNCIGEMTSFLRRLQQQGLAPTTILDVGAHKAEWSRDAHKVFPGAKFILIEPQVEMLPYLKAFCSESKGSRWELVGAGPSECEMVLNVWQDHLPGSSLLALPDDTASHSERHVPIITIDSLLHAESEIPQLVKLDIQGFELAALAGATKLFGVTQCFILEVSLFVSTPNRPLLADVVSFMNQRNYKVYDIPGFLRRPNDNALGEVDLAFALKGGVLDADQSFGILKR
jgi:FkbM family methyltransferase